ncbi:hypothetical protein BGW80DRAFT_1342010 [Lactifluus volemus]|nr:hypothetical protein BGW80DRAFT_1342010 [Lactifluus volemus]
MRFHLAPKPLYHYRPPAMKSPTTLNDDRDLMSRGRILRREWKRYKPHLPKSTSLPQLELAPAKRPLFTCRQCGFSNVYIPLCLWCSWTSTEATAAFVAATPRRSRCISGPGRVVWKDGISDPKPEDREANELTASSVTVQKMGALCGSEPLAPVATDTLQDSVLAARPDLPSERSSVVRATLKALGSQGADLEHKPGAIRARRGLPEAKVIIPPRQTTTRTIPAEMMPVPDRAPLYRVHHNAPIHPVSLPPIISATRTLHRKHHMTFPRQKSTRSLRSRVIAMSTPQPVPVVSAPVSVTQVDRTTQPSDHILTRQVHVLIPDNAQLCTCHVHVHRHETIVPIAAPGRPSFEFTRPRRSTTSGWSVSGEIELQIALSQRREEERDYLVEPGDEGASRKGTETRYGFANLVLRRS